MVLHPLMQVILFVAGKYLIVTFGMLFLLFYKINHRLLVIINGVQCTLQSKQMLTVLVAI